MAKSLYPSTKITGEENSKDEGLGRGEFACAQPPVED